MSFSHRILLSLLPIPRNYIVIFHIVNRRRHRPWIDRENFTRAFFWSADRVTHSRATASGQLASSVILSNYYIRRSYFSMQRDALHRFRFHELAFSMRWGAICFSSVSLSQRTGQSFKERVSLGVSNDTLRFSFLQLFAVSSLCQEIRIFGRVTCFLARQDWLFLECYIAEWYIIKPFSNLCHKLIIVLFA